MPTYQNNSPSVIPVESLYGGQIVVGMGQSIQTYRRYNIAGFNLIDEAPYWNPVKAIDTISMAAAGNHTVALAEGTKFIKVWKVNGSDITLYIQSSLNSPPVSALRPGDGVVINMDGRASMIVMAFAGVGSCEVIQATEEID